MDESLCVTDGRSDGQAGQCIEWGRNCVAITRLRQLPIQRGGAGIVYRVRQKSGPLKFFAVFSATVWNFNLKFYKFVY